MPWQRRLSALVRQDVTNRLEQAMRKVLIDTDQSVVQMTPVDTGRARGNWTAGINSASSGGGGLDPSGSATIARLNSAAQSFKVGDSFVVSNNLPYIERLENGWSDQAPSGMVAVSLARIPRRIDL